MFGAYLRMKKIYFLLILALVGHVSFGQNYCPTSVTPANVCANSFITSVTLANINNNNQLCDKDQLGGANVDDGYSDYTDMVAYLDPQVPTLLTVTISSLFTDAGVVWVDWNNDGQWDTDEMTNLIGDGYGTETFRALLVPPTDVATDTLIEGGIRINFDFLTPQLDPCGQNGYGEIEDYSFVVSANGPPDSTSTHNYCDARVDAANVCGNEWLFSFECNNVFQNDGNCDRDQLGGANIDDGYSDYSDLVIALEPNTPNLATVVVDGNILDVMQVFVDWNNNGTWETEETITFAGDGTPATSTFYGTIIPPVDAVTGVVIKGGLRIKHGFLTPETDPCADMQFGEIEDYSFYVVDPSLVTCSNYLFPADSAQDQCTNLTFLWNSSEGAGSYEFLLTNVNQDTIENLITSDTTYSSNLLQVSEEYKWKVNPIDTVGRKALGCETFTFFTSNNLAPEISFTPDSLEVCNGIDLKMTPTISGTNLNYDWILGGTYLDNTAIEQPNFNSTDDGFISLALKVSDQAGCADSAEVVVNVKPLPSINTLSIANQVICDGDSLAITYSTNNTGQQIVFLERAIPLGSATTSNPTSINGDQYYFVNTAGEYIYSAALELNGCVDTLLIDTAKFIQPLAAPQLIAEFPNNIGPCNGEQYLFRIANYNDGITWQNGVINDTTFFSSTTQVIAFYELEGCRVFADSLFEFDDYPAKPNLTSSNNGSLCDGDVVNVNHDVQSTSFVWYDANTTDINKTITTTTEIYISAISARGCVTASDTINLTFNPTPSKPIIDANGYQPVLCEGDMFTLENSDGISKVWSTGATSDEILVDQPGEYFLTVSEFGCSSNSDTIVAEFEAIPMKPVIQVVSENGIDSLMATTVADTYEWTFDGQLTNHTTQTILAAAAGSYQVIAISPNGCESEASEVFGYVVGIHELAFQLLDISINKVNGQPVWSSKNTNTFDVVVYNYQGKILDKANAVSSYEAKNFKGSYIVNITIEKESFVFKMK